MHVLFAGGGTAGHINPALAIAGYLCSVEPDTKVSYIGTAKNLESRLVPAAGYDFYTIDVMGLQRSLSPLGIVHNVKAVSKAVNASFKAKKLLKELKPDIVVGTGGYVSGPVLREAAKLGIKTAIHEQNAFPGVTTKALTSLVDRVMLAMPEAEKHLKLKSKPYHVGNPVRKELTEVSREEALEWAKKNGQKYKVELINDLSEDETISFYDLVKGDKVLFEDLCRGPHVENLSEIGVFRLTKVAGAIGEVMRKGKCSRGFMV